MSFLHWLLRVALFAFPLILAGQTANALVPHPGCYDYHGCVDPNSTPEEQEAQNEANWRAWGFFRPPDAYGHTAEEYTYILFGDQLIVTRPDGTEVTAEELIDQLPDSTPGWRDRAGDVGAVALILGGIGFYIPPVLPAAGAVGIGGGIGWIYCRVAEGP